MNYTTRRRFILLALFALTLAPVGTRAADAPGASARPNIVFILVDDLRYNAVGCMGHPFVQTPNIDALAKEGALFRNAFVTTPYCSPSRGSFLTGQYAHTHGIVANEEKSSAR